MASFTINGYLLAGAEYWPYVGTADIDYPKAVLWGFYPEKGVIAAGRDRAEPRLRAPRRDRVRRAGVRGAAGVLHANPAKLRRSSSAARDQGYVPRFYLWTNDYTRAATPYPPGVREARLWYWKRKTPDPPAARLLEVGVDADPGRRVHDPAGRADRGVPDRDARGRAGRALVPMPFT